MPLDGQVRQGARDRGLAPVAAETARHNLLIDGDWIGTFGTLDEAAGEAVSHVRPRGIRTKGWKVELLAYLQS